MTFTLPVWAVFGLGMLTVILIGFSAVGAVMLWDAWQTARTKAKLDACRASLDAIESSMKRVTVAGAQAALSEFRRGRDPECN